MEKLLKWSIANTNGDDSTKEQAGKPDPELLAQLFGGPDEPTLMNQNMSVITHPEATLDNREIAFDNFEMLIENLDNANNIQNMKLWTPLIAQLDDEHVVMRKYAASCVGTANQNNPNSIESFLKYDGALEKLVQMSLSETESQDVKLKTLYALSSTIRNNQPAYDRFNAAAGWSIIEPILNSKDSDSKIKLRGLSLLSSILSNGWDQDKSDNIYKAKIVPSIASLISKDSSISCVDRGLNLIAELAANQYPFHAEEIADIKTAMDDINSLKDSVSPDDYQKVKQVIC